jgi:hypothetical protein
MKKTIAALCAVVLFAQLAVVPRRAEAIVGVIVYAAKNHKVGVPLMIAGGVGIVPGAPIAGLIAAAAYTPPATTGFVVIDSAALVGIGVGVFVALLGLVVLDTGSGQDLAFKAVAPREALALGMTADEATSYNEHLAEINAMRETVRDDVLRAGTPGYQRVSDTWDAYSAALPKDAYDGLKKVSAGIRHTMGY